MFEGFTVIFLTTLVLVLLAVAVIVGLAITRRPADQWQSHLRTQTQQWSKLEDEGVELDDVHPEDVTLDSMLDAHGTEGSAYLDAEHIPGFEHLEGAAEKFEDLQVGDAVKKVLRPGEKPGDRGDPWAHGSSEETELDASGRPLRMPPPPGDEPLGTTRDVPDTGSESSGTAR